MSKILIVDHHAIHSVGRELYRELASTGAHEIKVLTPRGWGEHGLTTLFEAERGGLEIVPSRLVFGGKTHRNIYRRLGRELRSFHPDILLVNCEPEGFLALQAVILCRYHHLKTAVVFTTWRNMPYGSPGEPFPVKWSRLSKLIERYVLPRAAHGIAHSPSAPEIFALNGFSRISYIPPWVDLNRFKATFLDREPRGPTQPLDQPQLPLPGGQIHTTGAGQLQETDRSSPPPERLRVGFVGRLVPEKGVDILLRALSGLEYPVEALIVGDGPEKAALRSLAQSLGLADTCKFIPRVPQSAIPHVMSQFDVLVLPSRGRPGWKEQFGRVLIEAMATGAVVVGSDSGDIPAVVGDAGEVFHEGNSDELRKVLRRLATDRAFRRACTEAGMRRVTEEYSLTTALQRYRALIDELKFKQEIRKIDKTPSQQNQA